MAGAIGIGIGIVIGTASAMVVIVIGMTTAGTEIVIETAMAIATGMAAIGIETGMVMTRIAGDPFNPQTAQR